jgi:hypothetical protein
LTCLAASAEAPIAAVVLCCANDRWLNERPPWKLGRANERLIREAK